jgi:hypothetical protein
LLLFSARSVRPYIICRLHRQAITADASAGYLFFAELLALIVYPFGLLMFSISLVFLSEVAGQPCRVHDNNVRI